MLVLAIDFYTGKGLVPGGRGGGGCTGGNCPRGKLSNGAWGRRKVLRKDETERQEIT